MAVQTVAVNTLRYDVDKCVGCGMCLVVCPHGVFAQAGRVVRLERAEACIECGACQRNCPTGALSVDSGPGCAAALMHAALFGGEPTCGGPAGCCGSGPGACCGDGQAAPAKDCS
jgi:ferredoxin